MFIRPTVPTTSDAMTFLFKHLYLISSDRMNLYLLCESSRAKTKWGGGGGAQEGLGYSA